MGATDRYQDDRSSVLSGIGSISTVARERIVDQETRIDLPMAPSRFVTSTLNQRKLSLFQRRCPVLCFEEYLSYVADGG